MEAATPSTAQRLVARCCTGAQTYACLMALAFVLSSPDSVFLETVECHTMMALCALGHISLPAFLLVQVLKRLPGRHDAAVTPASSLLSAAGEAGSYRGSRRFGAAQNTLPGATRQEPSLLQARSIILPGAMRQGASLLQARSAASARAPRPPPWRAASRSGCPGPPT